jgi:MerR family transcriptional regulator, light-induced transcriptional regulator
VRAEYNIGAVSKLTGISLDTLRAWERRYQAVAPKRSARGRTYTARHVNRLRLLRQAVGNGLAISRIANFPDQDLRNLLDRAISSAPERTGSNPAARDILQPILNAIEGYKYEEADRELNRLAAAIASPNQVVHEVALPLMREIGERQCQERFSVAQEHMLSSLLSGLLSSFIRTFTPSNPPARILLATPRNERHGFPNLAAAMLAAAGGLGVINLGTDLPAAEISVSLRRSQANALLLSLSNAPGDQLLGELSYVARKAPKSASLWIGGPPDFLRPVKAKRWILLFDFHALEQQLITLGARY